MSLRGRIDVVFEVLQLACSYPFVMLSSHRERSKISTCSVDFAYFKLVALALVIHFPSDAAILQLHIRGTVDVKAVDGFVVPFQVPHLEGHCREQGLVGTLQLPLHSVRSESLKPDTQSHYPNPPVCTPFVTAAGHQLELSTTFGRSVR